MGAALGPPAALLVTLIFFREEVIRSFTDFSQPETLILIAMGAVGGATCGFTCAWRVSSPPREPS